MKRYTRRRHEVEHDDVHRWLVSYADYMTLLFALFVVLYAMAMINEKPFETITESIGRVFQADKDKPKNRGHGDDILPVNSSKTEKKLFGNGILDIAGPELVDGEKDLTNIKESQVGTNLSSIEKALNTALLKFIESGYAELKTDGDWLEIELNSGLLFPSGSASPTKSAKNVVELIYQEINANNNYIRVRGYTDNQAINTEVFSSNWELSVYRATAILHILEDFGINPVRMAIEGYGQYSPNENNDSASGRAKNRRVVIAISKFSADIDRNKITEINDAEIKVTTKNTDNKKQNTDAEVKVISLDNGGIIITSRKENNNK